MWPIIDLTEPTTQSPACAPALANSWLERLDLDNVAEGRARAVRLDVADRRRRDAGLGIGTLEARIWPSTTGAVRPRARPSLDAPTPLITA